MLAFLSFLPSFPNLSFHPPPSLLPSFPCLSLPYLSLPYLSFPFLPYPVPIYSHFLRYSTYRYLPILLRTPHTTLYHPSSSSSSSKDNGKQVAACIKNKKEEKQNKNKNKNKEVSYRHDYEESEYQDAPHGIYYCAQWRSWGTKST